MTEVHMLIFIHTQDLMFMWCKTKWYFVFLKFTGMDFPICCWVLRQYPITGLLPFNAISPFAELQQARLFTAKLVIYAVCSLFGRCFTYIVTTPAWSLKVCLFCGGSLSMSVAGRSCIYEQRNVGKMGRCSVALCILLGLTSSAGRLCVRLWGTRWAVVTKINRRQLSLHFMTHF